MRTATVRRRTSETDIDLVLNLDGSGVVTCETGIGFLDHMFHALAKHARMDLDLRCTGDLEVDDHHTAEDCAMALGEAFGEALGDRRGISRFGSAHAPLDEALARVVIDCSGRPHATVSLDLRREMIGTIATENLTHVFVSFAMRSKCTLHVDVLRGENDHHKIEAAFKAMALAIRQAVAVDGSDMPSTKGTLT